MTNKSGSPAPSRRSIAYQVLRKAYLSGPLSHSEYATSLSVRRYFGVVFKAIVLLIALAMLLPLAYLLYRAAGVGWTQAVDLLARMRTPSNHVEQPDPRMRCNHFLACAGSAVRLADRKD